MSLRVCFATPGAYPMLLGKAEVFGGSELRAVRLMQGLARRGVSVAMSAFVRRDRRLGFDWGEVDIVADPSGAQRNAFERWFGQRSGIAAREVSWARADAQVYVGFGAADYNAGLADWCRRASRAMVLMLGSDLDLSDDYRPGNTALNPYGSVNENCRRALEGATAIIAQTDWQAERLSVRIGRSATVLPNPVYAVAVAPRDRRHFLWVGKSSAPKRPELLLELARRVPNSRFRMVLNPMDADLDTAIRRDRPPNVEIVSGVSPEAIGDEYAVAIALVNTSAFEGMPNTFLEAGVQRTPVLSLEVDPDRMLARSGGGRCADGDIAELTAMVADAAHSPDAYRRMGEALEHYVVTRHTPEPVLERFYGVIQEVAG